MKRYLTYLAVISLFSTLCFSTNTKPTNSVLASAKSISASSTVLPTVKAAPTANVSAAPVTPAPVASTTPTPAPVAAAPVVISAPTYSSDHDTLMAEAGIAPSDYGAVDYIISHESGWSVDSYNSEGSGAYGLCQAEPGDKMASAGADWATNPVTQLEWCTSHAIADYGSWWGAYDFWIINHWW